MNQLVEMRVVKVANYIAKNKSTVRNAARNFGISKSTVHKDVSERLRKINQNLYIEVKKVMNKNKEIRHIRGGQATKFKYLKLHANSS